MITAEQIAGGEVVTVSAGSGSAVLRSVGKGPVFGGRAVGDSVADTLGETDVEPLPVAGAEQETITSADSQHNSFTMSA